MDNQTKKIPILVVTYHFPPRGGVSVQRIVKFIKYLPNHGFHPIVLTVNKPLGSVAEDIEMMEEVPDDVRIFRSESFEPYHIYRALGGTKRQDDPSFRSELVAKAGKRGIASKLYFEYQRRYLIPDPKIGWLRPALGAAKRIFEQYSPKAVISTSPEATAHLIALKLHEIYDVPFVADFRDPWTSGHYSLDRPKKAHMKEMRMEDYVLHEAGAVTVVMQSLIKDFLKVHPGIAQSKFHVIPNGFDEADYKKVVPRKFEHFTLAHTGSVYHQRSPVPLFKALKEFLRLYPDAKNEIRMLFLGQVDPQYFRTAVEMGIADIIIHERFASHSDSLSTQLGADVLVILSEGVMTAKVYEYLRASKPIIGFAPKGEFMGQIHEWGVGRIFEPDDYLKASELIAQMYNSWKYKKPNLWNEYKKVDLRIYERSYQASQLADILRGLVS